MPRKQRNINVFSWLRPYDRSNPAHQLQLSILRCQRKNMAVTGTRRGGKTFSVHLVFLHRFLALLLQRARQVERRQRPPWRGAGRIAKEAITFRENVTRALVIAPKRKHLQKIQQYLQSTLAKSGASIYQHRDPSLRIRREPMEMWFVAGKTAGVITFLVASHTDQLVGDNADILWLDECNDIDNPVWDRIRPLVADTGGSILLTGTPSMGGGHWYTKQLVAGLPPDHERADSEIAKPDPDWQTFIISPELAYLPEVQTFAKKEIEKEGGKQSVYILTQIQGDWRIPNDVVFPWDSDVHLCTVSLVRGDYVITWKQRKVRMKEKPRVIGGIDWFRGTAPGGAVVCFHWPKHPFIPGDKRGLLVVVDEYSTQKDENYSDQGFLKQLKKLQSRYGVRTWYADPSSPEKTKLAKRLGVYVKDANNRDKEGRIALIQHQLGHSDKAPPAMMVDSRCKRTSNQLSRYHRARDKEGNVTEKFVQYNDWLVDSLAYLVPYISAGYRVGGPA